MTQTRNDALQELLAKVEAGSADWDADFMGEHESIMVLSAWRGSLDEALGLHNAVLPGWWYSLDWKMASVTDTQDGPWFNAFTENNPARAWLMAILKALISEITQ